jgi:hypothetical protein
MNIYKGYLTTLLLIEITEIEIDMAFLLFPSQALHVTTQQAKQTSFDNFRK